MNHDGEDSRASGWNRRFIEEQFGKDIADRLRRTLMNIWREDHPTLPSERPKDERNTYLIRWQLGLAALYAEAEDPLWATKLTEEEAKLAAAIRPHRTQWAAQSGWKASSMPAQGRWMTILGNELSWELDREPHAHMATRCYCRTSTTHQSRSPSCFFLDFANGWTGTEMLSMMQATSLGPPSVFDKCSACMLNARRRRYAAHTCTLSRVSVSKMNLPEELVFVWLLTLMRVDPELAVHPRLKIGSERSSRERVVKRSIGSALCSAIIIMRLI